MKRLIIILDVNKELIGIQYDGVDYKREGQEDEVEFLYRVKQSNKEINEAIKNKNYAVYIKKEYEASKLNTKQEAGKLDTEIEEPKKPQTIENKEVPKKANGKGTLAIVLALLAIAGSAIAIHKSNKAKVAEPQAISIENLLGLSEEQIANMTYEDLAKYLEEGKQRETFDAINNFQKEFNNNLGKDQELYLTAEELIAFQIMANSETYNAETMAKIFGSLIDVPNIEKNYEQFLKVMYSYYMTTTESSGISTLFANEDCQKLVDTYEKLIISYNKSTNAQTKQKYGKEIVNFLKEFASQGKYEKLYQEYPEAASYILQTGKFFTNVNGIINQSDNKTITEMGSKATCTLYSYVETAGQYIIVHGVGDNNYALEIAPEVLNNRNIEKDAKREIYGIDNKAQQNKSNANNKKQTNNKKPEPEKDKNTVEHKTETVTREEAIEDFGKQEVEDQEDDAKKQTEKDNKAEEQRAEDLQKGYNDIYQQAYEHAAQTGESLEVEIPEGSEAYQEGFKKAIEEATKDAQEEYEARVQAVEALNTQAEAMAASVNSETQVEEEIEVEENIDKGNARVKKA